MKIKKLTLSGYRRMLLNNIKKITFTPTSVLQLVLGTNGSGKSSILYELGPLPANSSDYIKGGFKEIVLEHNGVEYTLTSKFKSGNKHSFVKAGEELNPGGTGAVQTELVFMEFGINKEIHEFLVGQTNFTDLSPSKRREWIVKLSDIDFTYALSVFKSLNSAARDAQGALKHVKVRSVSEMNKLLAIGDLEELEKRYKELTDEINFVFKQKTNKNDDFSDIKTTLSEVMVRIKDTSQKLLDDYPRHSGEFKFDSLDDVSQVLERISREIMVKSNLRDNHLKTLSDLQDMDIAVGQDVFSKPELESKIKKLDKEISAISKKIPNHLMALTDMNEVNLNVSNIGNSFVEIISELPVNTENYLNKESYHNKKSNLADVRQRLSIGEKKTANLEAQLVHLNSLKEAECPKCNHKWIPGRDEAKKKELDGLLVKFNDRLTILKKQEKELSEYVEQYEDYSYRLRQVRELRNQTLALSPFWSYLEDKRLLEDSPKLAIMEFEVLKQQLYNLTTIEQDKEHKEKLTSLLEGDSLDKLSKLKNNIESLEKDLKIISEELNALYKQEVSVSKYKKMLMRYLEESEYLDSCIQQLHELKDRYIDSIREQELDNVLNKSQEELAFIQVKRTDKITLEGIIKDLELDLVSIKERYDAYKLLSDELSPIDGLIAEQLKGFINTYVGHVNQVIENIWTHELEVLPCSSQGLNVDYKFPLRVYQTGEGQQTPDISKGSEAQVEIVNFAFRLVTMSYLGLEEYPIYLDEFSKSFDEQHRQNAMDFIKELVETTNYSQLFFISHYASQFGAFSSAEILVLDPTNISVPTRHNEHVLFE